MSIVIRDVREHELDSVQALNNNAGMAILVISEELEELFELADTIQVLYHGRLSPPLVTRDTRAEEIGRYMIGARPEKAIA